MKSPKTLVLIECRGCGGSYYGGDAKLILNPGTESELPDEISFVIRKIAKCVSCKQIEDRTLGGQRKRFER
jgi:hypothetical protein